jgi:hypothetical protein
MYKLLGISALFILGLSPSDKIPVEPFPEITSSYPLNWRCETGNASFRTNVAFIPWIKHRAFTLFPEKRERSLGK